MLIELIKKEFLEHVMGFRFMVSCVLCMGMVIGLLVLFRKRLNRQGPLAKAMAISSYTVYIIHQLVLVLFGLALSGIGLPHLLKFSLVAPVAVAPRSAGRTCLGLQRRLLDPHPWTALP